MKGKFRTALYVLSAVVITAAIMSAMTYLGISDNERVADNKAPGVPYYSQTPPDTAGILFRFTGGGSVFLNLDFYEEKISVILFDTKTVKQSVLDYGYTVTYTVDTDYIFLAELIDRFGGIEMELEGSLLRYTGVQVTDLLQNKQVDKRQVISVMLQKISKNGFSKNDLLYIIKNTTTELNFPSGYPYIEPLPKICRNVSFVN